MDDQIDQFLLKVRPHLLSSMERDDALRLLADEAAAGLGDIAPELIYKDASERERVETTYIGMGLAVPHARVEGLQRAAVYVAFSQAGIPWPHEEAHFIALLVVPWESPEMHLQLLARLVRWRRSHTEAETCVLAEYPDQLAESLNEAFADLI